MQDTTKTIDVSKYFSDPDGDVLKLSASPVENIRVDVEGMIARLIPDAGWFGERSTVFTVDDGQNGVVSSNEVKLIVQKSWVSASLKDHLPQVISGVLFVVVVVLLIVFRESIIKFLDEED